MSALDICAPALVYLIIGIIAIASMFYHEMSVKTIIFKSIFIILWTFVLNLICQKGYVAVSWILVLLPYVLGLLVLFMMWDAIKKNEHFKNEKEQHRK